MDAALVARLFGLGEPRSEPVPLTGYGTAGAWRLDTDRGRWAVKAVTPVEPWEPVAMRDAGELERGALAAGLLVPRPVEPRGDSFGYWAAVPGRAGYVRVSEWVTGDQPRIPVDKPLAAWLGETVAALADVAPPASAGHGRGYAFLSEDEWRERAGAAEALVGRQEARELLAAAGEATAIVEAGLANAPPMVVCHRDISFRNILLTSGGPALIDFDLAGPESPWWELVHFAFLVACASLGGDEPEPVLVAAAVSAYAERGGPVGAAGTLAFTGLLRGMLEWAAGSLELAPASGRARAEFVHAARVLPVIVRSLDRWADLLERS
ncbi:aminoglycoside phosphotransferase family protein [Nonomuraea rhizosphaerae]|uniref:aminoglycoside phosphotransferase family protein n=1 Tax=Nonomuraea rhizosphaerae TaxID=2665663 RepID=UPI001C5E0E72|nr:aminoglycoside phosphotransferase family protein [Nonomuraea rhizosphaerae]